jgi:chemotaxis protein CheZ
MSDEFDQLFDEVAAQYVPSGEKINSVELGAASALTPTDSAPVNSEHLYGRLGTIVRSLHDSLRELGFDKSLTDAASSIADANDRLSYIGTLTEEAANKVLNTLDEAMPAQEAFLSDTKKLNETWSLLFQGAITPEAFKQLSHETHDFLSNAEQRIDEEKARLLQIMMAQGFQDLTGQLIKKIISVTSRVESELAQLLRDHAPAELKQRVAAETSDLMAGPGLPSQSLEQNDVDSLLAGLGF